MRYIGNKTRLLPFVLGTIRRLAIEPGIAHDAFAGTAAVGRALKGAGWSVVSSDIMTYSYVFQRAYVVASGATGLRRLKAAESAIRSAALASGDGAMGELTAVGAFLATGVEPSDGFITRHFAPAGGRMYFTDDNARRIDAARHALHRWRTAGLLDDDAYYLLLAAVIEGADRVANTAGVYAAYIKKWQPNALRPVSIVPESPLPGVGSSANLADAVDVARRIGEIDLLYLDPPYNSRQYSGYYHVPEILARGWFDEPIALRGKTGLPSAVAQRSEWCTRVGAPRALRELLAATGARHVLVSYNSEGVIPDRELRAILADAAVDGRVRRFTRRYRRYRADSDHAKRRYRGDTVRELLYYARLRK